MAAFTIKKSELTPLLLRCGLALLFLYASISALKNPQDWVGYLPRFARTLVPGMNTTTLLHVFSVYELALALWLLSGKYVKAAALVTVATLSGIVVFNFTLFAITFRDMALAVAALALFFSK